MAQSSSMSNSKSTERGRTPQFTKFLQGTLGKVQKRAQLIDRSQSNQGRMILNDLGHTAMQNAAMPIAAIGTQQAVPMSNVDRMTAADRAAAQLLPSGKVHPVWGKPGLSNTFGAARSGGRQHQGMDIFAPEGTPVMATVPGTVTRGAYNNSLGGTSFGYEDDQGNYHYYTHLSAARSIPTGTRIAPGDILGNVGRTGNAATTPPHLHYSINEGRASVINAFDYLTR